MLTEAQKLVLQLVKVKIRVYIIKLKIKVKCQVILDLKMNIFTMWIPTQQL